MKREASNDKLTADGLRGARQHFWRVPSNGDFYFGEFPPTKGEFPCL
jgi:hypothetical protein